MSDPRLDASLGALDRALAARPRRDGQAFSDATKPMCAYRDELRHALRAAPDDLALRRRLKAANLAVTLMLAGHFPLGDMPWDRIETLRDHLAAMRRDAAALNAPPTALQALWLRRMRQDLPAAAVRHPEWPVRRDHCFGRVILDAVCGAPWREVVAPPAWRHLSPEQLRRAVALADAVLAGESDLEGLNRASLDLRRGHRRIDAVDAPRI